MVKQAIWENPSPIVYRIKNTKTGQYITGGHGTQNGIYGSLTGVKLGFRRALESWWIKEKEEDYVIEVCEIAVKETLTPEELKGRK